MARVRQVDHRAAAAQVVGHRPFPFEPLEQLLRERTRGTTVHVAGDLGIQRRQAIRLRATGPIVDQADELAAAAAGVCLAEEWSDWWDAAIPGPAFYDS